MSNLAAPVSVRKKFLFFNDIITTMSPVTYITLLLFLSWFYALCSQCIIPLPFNLAPLSLQPLPLFVCSFFFGWPAFQAYILYLTQGALGAPFFAGMQGGIMRFFGPTGGYLIGFGLASLFIVMTRFYKQENKLMTLFKLYGAYIFVFGCGLLQLAHFVAAEALLASGFYPFIVGDLIIKTSFLLVIVHGKIK